MTTHTVEVNFKSGKVEIEYNDKLLDQIRERYNMLPTDRVDDDLIITYLQSEVRSALSKLEGKDV